MKTWFAFALGVAGCLAAGCAGDDVEVTLEPGQSALSEKGNDSLFTLKIGETSKEFKVADIKVKATLDDKAATELSAAVTDANANGKLDVGDSIVCSEPATNAFDASTVGKELSIELLSGSERIGESTWKPTR